MTGFLLGSSIVHAETVPDFSREILPLFSENCFACHGPDAAHREAKLRLDDEANAKLERNSGNAIVPGSSDDSALYYRITTEDPEEIMPPPDSFKTLTAAQKDMIRRWIDAGAPWGLHWSLAPLIRPDVPAHASSHDQTKNPIDAFVRTTLAREKLQPAPEASRHALIRRLTLDLTGLPPTPEDVATFVADKTPNAYAKLVDRLLASPAYGERMAWDWM